MKRNLFIIICCLAFAWPVPVRSQQKVILPDLNSLTINRIEQQPQDTVTPPQTKATQPTKVAPPPTAKLQQKVTRRVERIFLLVSRDLSANGLVNETDRVMTVLQDSILDTAKYRVLSTKQFETNTEDGALLITEITEVALRPGVGLALKMDTTKVVSHAYIPVSSTSVLSAQRVQTLMTAVPVKVAFRATDPVRMLEPVPMVRVDQPVDWSKLVGLTASLKVPVPMVDVAIRPVAVAARPMVAADRLAGADAAPAGEDEPSPGVNALPVRPSQWTLQACIDYAIINNISLRQLEVQRKDAEIQHNTARNSRLPNLNAGVVQQETFNKVLNSVTADPSQYSEREYMSTGNSATNISLTSSMPIFTGFRISNEIARAKAEFNAATEQLAKAREDVALQITSLFMQSLYNRELLNITREQLTLSKEQVKRTALIVEKGNLPGARLYDVQAQLAKDSVSVVEARNAYEIALLELAQALDLNAGEAFDISVPEFEANVIAQFAGSLLSPTQLYYEAILMKPGVRQLQYKVESAERSLNIAKSGYYPQLQLDLSVGSNYVSYFDPQLMNNAASFDGQGTGTYQFDNRPFFKSLRENANQIIGLNLSIPIFNRFQTRNQVRSARLSIDYQRLALSDFQKTLYKEIQTAHKNATAAMEKLASTLDAVTAAAEALRYAQRSYEVGRATVYEYDEAKTRYAQSQSESAQAKYDYILRTKILDFYRGIPIKL